jgi:hypothetical protein
LTAWASNSPSAPTSSSTPKRYESVDEIPLEARAAYEKAIGASADSVEAMPPEARRLYESVMANLPHLAPSAPRPDPALQTIEPVGAPRWLLAAAAIGAGLLLVWFLRRG